MTAVAEPPRGRKQPAEEHICSMISEADRRKRRPPCGTPMLLVGKAHGGVWICPKCDQVYDDKTHRLLPGQIVEITA